MAHHGQQGVTFASGGHKLVGTLFLARGDEPKATALLLHGVPGIEKNYDIAQALRDAGWNALLFHYRGCWGSEGPYRFRTLTEDVFAALAYLRAGAHVQVDTDRLALIGHSGGGAAAILVGAADPDVLGVAAYGAPADLRWLGLTPAWIDANWVPWLSGVSGADLVRDIAECGDALAPVAHVAGIAPRPLLIIHGERDEAIPVKHGVALAERAGLELQVNGEADHAFAFQRPWLCRQLLSWIDLIG